MGMNQFGSFSFMFTIFPIIFFLMSILIIGVTVYSISQKVKQNTHNNNSPVLTVDAVITSKRTDVSSHYHNNATDNSLDHYNSSTWYYTTFQVESGDRIELEVTGSEYGLLAEGDIGKLTFQGTRYLGFVRK
ncbi:DUF2500 domain-containing protein [Anaerocolumna sp. MB42-C2]|uniref:DUF2500 domain-containing protein n=1 Tax=Anaerocolumna sp. MB42-C2 TaxID=3070997 RepID=UPI0027DEEF51|nr:DUF2500 domain-containing protein [Anaerocolumna sp. MB42-C2]WMJ89413.1 DUF2500 domain-containing protein [Anaerocolumna sp. MB42-C2]